MNKLLLALGVGILLIGLGWFYSHPYFIYNPFQSKMWHLWDKVLIFVLLASHIDKRKDIYSKICLIGVCLLCFVRVLWQLLELENEVEANNIKLIFVLYILDMFAIAWVMHIKFIVNTFRRWNLKSFFFTFLK